MHSRPSWSIKGPRIENTLSRRGDSSLRPSTRPLRPCPRHRLKTDSRRSILYLSVYVVLRKPIRLHKTPDCGVLLVLVYLGASIRDDSKRGYDVRASIRRFPRSCRDHSQRRWTSEPLYFPSTPNFRHLTVPVLLLVASEEVNGCGRTDLNDQSSYGLMVFLNYSG